MFMRCANIMCFLLLFSLDWYLFGGGWIIVGYRGGGLQGNKSDETNGTYRTDGTNGREGYCYVLVTVGVAAELLNDRLMSRLCLGYVSVMSRLQQGVESARSLCCRLCVYAFMCLRVVESVESLGLRVDFLVQCLGLSVESSGEMLVGRWGEVRGRIVNFCGDCWK